MTEAVNLGIPALKHVRALRRHLAPIVREIAGVGAQKKGWFRRLFG
jgi:pilus assembly protein CpaE